MGESIVGFLDAFSSKVFWTAAMLLAVINGAAVVAFLATRSRRLVNEWTPKLVAADAMLLSAGLGVPLVTALAKLGIRAISSMLGGGATPVD